MPHFAAEYITHWPSVFYLKFADTKRYPAATSHRAICTNPPCGLCILRRPGGSCGFLPGECRVPLHPVQTCHKKDVNNSILGHCCEIFSNLVNPCSIKSRG